MHDLVSSKKTDNGIIVCWSEGNQVKDRSFTHQELVEMKIDADDLLGRPMLYKITMELNKYLLKR
ncbi:MAG: hypothetical protein CVV32_11690 [Methanomicrobiales archaeon HGW-Methanomicrobiales-3]|jgi:hypothetical protein|nr:MAG: hypothetical protein CVV32_11690 [Methanomicrobiales archaeon HGW-Methanomicrobiales-3]